MPAPNAPGRLLTGLALLVVLAAAVFGLSLGSRPAPEEPPATATPTPTEDATPPSASPSPDASPEPTPEPLPLEGLHVVLDPGHNGGNASAPAQINSLVDDGRGVLKACNTVGSSTPSGYPEHAFTLDVALKAADLLRADGAEVTLTRSDDTGVGPCVDARGRAPQEHDADVMVSLHADGSDNPAVRGFFAIVSDPPLNEAQGAPSTDLAADMLAALTAAGFTPSSSYPGALSKRPDLGTLNWSERPVVMLELAEMRNPEEAALIEDPAARQRYAEAVAAGLRAWEARQG